MNRTVFRGGHAASAAAFVDTFHPDVIEQVAAAVENDAVVVVGMAQNPHVRWACTALKSAGIEYTYLEYGSYISQWKARLAIKMWSGWPTFPQVFARGTLIGGNVRVRQAIEDGSLQALLSADVVEPGRAAQ